MSHEQPELNTNESQDQNGVALEDRDHHKSGVLAKLYQLILDDLNCAVGSARWSKLMASAIRTKRFAQFDRGNFMKLVTKTEMTWQGFLKALYFARVRKIRFSVEIWREREEFSTIYRVEMDDLGAHLKSRKTKPEHYHE